MKKILVFAFLLLNLIANAQVRNYKNGTKSNTQLANENSKKLATTVKETKTVKTKTTNYNSDSDSSSGFGIIAGVNFANEEAIVGELNNPSARIGLTAGVTYKTQFSDFFGFGANLVYANMGATFDSDLKDELNYIQLPVFVTLGGSVFKAKIGPQVGYLVSAKFDGEDYADFLATFDFGAYIGVEVRIPNSQIGITSSYYYGLSDINEGQSDLQIRNTAFSVGLAYYLK